MPKRLGESRGLLGADQPAAFFDVAEILPGDPQLAREGGLGKFLADAQGFDSRREGERAAEDSVL